jgi:hypothetical protein
MLNNFLADDALAIQAGGAFIASRIQEMGGARRDADADRTGELLVRLFVGLVLIPPKSTDLSDPDQARRLAREVIAPLMLEEGGPR